LVGGVDPSGGAGLTADVRTVHALGCVPLTVPTCLTVQNRREFASAQPVGADLLRDMIRAAVADGPIDAVKIGLLGEAGNVELLAEELDPLASLPVVVDPVLSATAGGWLPGGAWTRSYRSGFADLAPIMTPNLPELGRLTAEGPQDLLSLGYGAVLVTGGHGTEKTVEDHLWTSAGDVVFSHPRLRVGSVHGTGCALASALACGLARGLDVEAASGGAIAFVSQCLRLTEAGRAGGTVPLVISGTSLR